MSNSTRLGRSVLAAALFVGAMIVTASPAQASTFNVLRMGQSTTFMTSASGQYELTLFGDSMQLGQQIHRFGVSVWATPAHSLALSGAKLTMQGNGNVVLRNHAGRAVWNTHTAGTGTHNRLVLMDSGDLVVYTAASKRVWSSGSGPALLLTGSVLKPGQFLRSRYDDSTPWVRLVMQRNGNLVLSYAGHARWSTGTHIAGSRLVGLSSGNWVVVTPHNNSVWSTRTAVHHQTFLFALPAGHAANVQVVQRSNGHTIFSRVA
jgi:hypothetical protein